MARECTKPHKRRSFSTSPDRKGSPHPKKSYPTTRYGTGIAQTRNEPNTRKHTPASGEESSTPNVEGSSVKILRDPLRVEVPGVPEGAVGMQHGQFVMFNQDLATLPENDSAEDGGSRIKRIAMNVADPPRRRRGKAAPSVVPASERMTTPSEERYRNETWEEKSASPESTLEASVLMQTVSKASSSAVSAPGKAEAIAEWQKLGAMDDRDWERTTCECGRTFNPNGSDGVLYVKCDGCIKGTESDGYQMKETPEPVVPKQPSAQPPQHLLEAPPGNF